MAKEVARAAKRVSRCGETAVTIRAKFASKDRSGCRRRDLAPDRVLLAMKRRAAAAPLRKKEATKSVK